MAIYSGFFSILAHSASAKQILPYCEHGSIHVFVVRQMHNTSIIIGVFLFSTWSKAHLITKLVAYVIFRVKTNENPTEWWRFDGKYAHWSHQVWPLLTVVFHPSYCHSCWRQYIRRRADNENLLTRFQSVWEQIIGTWFPGHLNGWRLITYMSFKEDGVIRHLLWLNM